MDILSFFSEIKFQYKYEQEHETILFNNKAILIGGKSFFLSEWFSKGIICIKDLMKMDIFFPFKSFKANMT